ncbi:toprim domain-containing protein [Aliikangiella maris]|uniref:Toprim domain-containing protein n=2 Tax=Aliikangiella maris TaxID=3162458 RepID=A0ABV3MVA2_9GAMM
MIDFYHETLKQSPDALQYLESRGLNHPELINTFKLGFANRTLGYRLPEKNRKAGAEIRGRLQSVGILRKTGHEHFNGCLVVPVINEAHQVKEVYGRKILGSKLRKGTAQHLYLPGEHQGVWNAQCLAASDEIILCESLIDAMSFWVNGLRNVTTSYGTNGFTEELLNAFIQHEIKRVLIAYDRDEAGDNAAKKLAEHLKKYDIDCYRVLFPKGMDVNEYALQMNPADKALGLVVRKAEPMLSAKKRNDNESLKAEKTVNQEKETPPDLVAELPEPTAQVQPKVVSDVEAHINEREIKIVLGDRCYRVRGLSKNLSYDQLKVNVMVNKDEAIHVDTLELYNAKQRQTFIKIASSELGVEFDVIKKDLGKVLLKLEALQDEQIENKNQSAETNIELDEQEKNEALALLKDKNLLQRILSDFNECGVVGEETNKLVGYLASVSRKLDKPLAVIIQSSSAAGKSSLMDAVLNLMPEEERVQYSAMTGQSLFYMGETNLKNKILAIAEEEGAENASYALKLLQSEGEITIASTGKNATTGNMETQTYHVEGPVMLFLTTTAIDIDEELLNRCLVLTVNESGEQTEAIQQIQRMNQTLDGLLQSEIKSDLIKVHRNAQRLLRPLKVVNPYAEYLTFRSDKTRTRRDHVKYLTLIQTIALLHQYQRPIKTVTHQERVVEYVEVTLDDIDRANQLSHEILGKTLDELPPQTRKLLSLINHLVKTQCKAQGMDRTDYRFSRRTIREVTGWSDGQLKIHCGRLEEMEYLLVHRGGRGKLIEYELLYDGELKTERHMMGLIDVELLKQKYEYAAQKSGQKGNKSAPSQGQVSAKSDSGVVYFFTIILLANLFIIRLCKN